MHLPSDCAKLAVVFTAASLSSSGSSSNGPSLSFVPPLRVPILLHDVCQRTTLTLSREFEHLGLLMERRRMLLEEAAAAGAATSAAEYEDDEGDFSVVDTAALIGWDGAAAAF